MPRQKEDWQEIEIGSLPDADQQQYAGLLGSLEVMTAEHKAEREELTAEFFDNMTRLVEKATGRFVKRINIRWGNLAVVLQDAPISATGNTKKINVG